MQHEVSILENKWWQWGSVKGPNGNVHFHRLPLFYTRWLCIYIHHFMGDDDFRIPHDHPKRFISFGLWGSYIERVYKKGKLIEAKIYRAPWIRSFPATHTHRLVSVKNAWTLVITLPYQKSWGYWEPDGTYYDKDTYAAMLNERINDND